MKKLGLFLHNNCEETEAVATWDVLKREGYEVDLISVERTLQVRGAHGLMLSADLKMNMADYSKYDGLIIPGGPGVDTLIDNKAFLDVITDFSKTNKLLAAICAAPQILGKLGLLENKNITHFPGADKFLSLSNIDLSKPSIIDGNIITGQSIGSAIQFGLTIVEYFDGPEKRELSRQQLVTNYK